MEVSQVSSTIILQNLRIISSTSIVTTVPLTETISEPTLRIRRTNGQVHILLADWQREAKRSRSPMGRCEQTEGMNAIWITVTTSNAFFPKILSFVVER